jgi:hypothetical protein
MDNLGWCIYSETSIVPGSVIQFLWSLGESYLNYGSRIYRFPGSIVSFSDPRWKRWIEVSLILQQDKMLLGHRTNGNLALHAEPWNTKFKQNININSIMFLSIFSTLEPE